MDDLELQMGVMDSNVAKLTNKVHLMNYTLVDLNHNVQHISNNLLAYFSNQNFESSAYPPIFDEPEDDEEEEEEEEAESEEDDED